MKKLPTVDIPALVEQYGSPVYIYDWNTIADQIGRLRQFDVIRYAQKACSNINLLKRMRTAGVMVDAVSNGEIERALRAGYTSEGDPAGVVFTSDIIGEDALATVIQHDVPVNAGSMDMLDQIGEMHPGHRVWIRVNPGFGHGHSRKTNTGGEWSKHGVWFENLDAALERVDAHGLDLVGLHMHIGSGTDLVHLQKVCDAMVDHVQRIGRDLRSISGGGGLPIPYRGGKPFDTAALFEHWNSARQLVEHRLGHDVSLEIEPGRFLVAQAGILVARVRAVKSIGGNAFVMVDAGFDNLVRPAMYGSYHEISVLDPSGSPRESTAGPTVVAGPLCESGDVFTQEEGGVVVPRSLPEAKVGDLIVFHDTGAYASSMASNYNSRLLAPELLVCGSEVELIRRRQTMDDLLALETL